MKLFTIHSLSKLLLIAVLFASQNLYAGKKIIKWVDSNGVTHYGDKPPMPAKARQSTEINKYGVALEETSTGTEKSSSGVDKEQSSEAQQRYDRALLASFASTNEIEIARKRNVKIDELALESLMQKQTTLKTRAAENKQSNSTELSNLQSIELQIEAKKAKIAEVNQRYENDKLRYIELTTNKESVNQNQ